MKTITTFVVAGLLSTLAAGIPLMRRPRAPVPYPEGFRTWSHVKSSVISPTHKTFAVNGGFQHVYANERAMAGYRTRNFPEGAVIVVEWLEMRDNNGGYSEGPHRQVDIMFKDARQYSATGGWGFQRYVRDSKTELAKAPTPEQCYACHDQLKNDGLVLSSYRQ